MVDVSYLHAAMGFDELEERLAQTFGFEAVATRGVRRRRVNGSNIWIGSITITRHQAQDVAAYCSLIGIELSEQGWGIIRRGEMVTESFIFSLQEDTFWQIGILNRFQNPW